MELAMVVILIGILTLVGGGANDTALDVDYPPTVAPVETGSPACRSSARHQRDLTLPYGEQAKDRRNVACQRGPLDG